MSRSSTFLHWVLLGTALAGSLGFGAAQALAKPAGGTAVTACTAYPDPDLECSKICRRQGASYGYCDREDGLCICVL
ncbi:MAG TPA: hypothetical protein VF746_05850 [Longimicrobium sp.]|jgi:hypothetical protein